MRIAAVILGMTVFAAANVYAEEPFGWRDANGKRIPDSDTQKSSKGFGASMALTPDADWAEKWARPETPQFTTIDELHLGESFVALVFFVNPAVDKDGNARIVCDYLITRPDGSISTELKGKVCAEGPLQGDPYNMRLVEDLLGFSGEASDLEGTWTIKVRLTDAVRDATVELKKTFEYTKVAKPKT